MLQHRIEALTDRPEWLIKLFALSDVQSFPMASPTDILRLSTYSPTNLQPILATAAAVVPFGGNMMFG